MRTAVADTSIAAHDALIAAGALSPLQREIFAHLCRHAHRDWTRKELSRALGMEPGTVAGRVNELRDELRMIEELPARRCQISGHSAHPVRPIPMQSDLFAA